MAANTILKNHRISMALYSEGDIPGALLYAGLNYSKTSGLANIGAGIMATHYISLLISLNYRTHAYDVLDDLIGRFGIGHEFVGDAINIISPRI